MVQRQRRHDRRLLRRHDRHHGRGRGARPGAQGDRADRGDQPLVRLRVRGRRPLLPATPRRRPTRASTRRWLFDFGFGRTVPADPSEHSPTPSRPAPASAARSSTPRRATAATRTTPTFWKERDYPRDAGEVPRRDADPPRLERLQRQAGRGPRPATRRIPVDDPRDPRGRGRPGKCCCFMTQGTHCAPARAGPRRAASTRSCARYLLEDADARPTLDDAAAGPHPRRRPRRAHAEITTGDAWPLPGTGRRTRLHLNRTFEQDLDGVTVRRARHRRGRRARLREPLRRRR